MSHDNTYCNCRNRYLNRWRFFKKIPRTKVKMNYIKVILFLTISIGLTLATEIIHDGHLKKRQLYEDCPISAENISYIPRYKLRIYTIQLGVDTKLNYTQTVGRVDMRICVSHSNLSTLRLHAQHLKIQHIQMWRWSSMTVIKNNYSIEKSNLIISFEDSLSPGLYTLTIIFKSTDFFFQSKYRDSDNKLLLITLPHDKLFPRYAEVRNPNKELYKVTFQVSVWHDINYTVLSNAKGLQITNPKNSNSLRTIFERITMMLTDNLVIVLLPTTHYSSNNSDFLNPIINTWSTYVYKMSPFSPFLLAQSVIKDVTLRMFRYTNGIYPTSKIDHVIIWDVQSESNRRYQGLIIYRQLEISYQMLLDPLSVKFDVIKKIIPKVVLQWIHSLTVPTINNRLWLEGSFTLFFTLYMTNKILGEQYEMLTVMDFLYYLDKYNSWQDLSVSSLDNNYYHLPIYTQGALLLRMLQHIIGEETFQNGVIEFLNKGKDQSVTIDDLWSAMQTALDATSKPKVDIKKVMALAFLANKDQSVTIDDLWSAMQTALDATSKPKVDIKKVMDTYVNGHGYPIVIVDRDYETGETIITQQCFQNFDMLHDFYIPVSKIPRHKIKCSEWRIPITWATQINPNFNDTSISWLEPNETIKIRTNPDDWIILNLKQTGYYRVLYDRTHLEKIGNFLNNEDYTKIHVLNRARLIYDICDMFAKGRIDWTLFTSITSYLPRETDYIVWSSMTDCLTEWRYFLKDYLNFPESKKYRMELAGYFENIMVSIYVRKSHGDEFTEILKWKLRDLACQLGSLVCREQARNQFEKFLADPKELNRFGRQPTYWAFCYGLKTANITIWQQMLRYITGFPDHRTLCPLACTDDSNIIMSYLLSTVKTPIKNNTAIPELISCIFDSNGNMWIENDKVFSYLLDEFVSKRHLYTNDLTIRLIKAVVAEDKLDRIYNVITNTYNNDTDWEFIMVTKTRKEVLNNLRNKFDNVQQNKIF